jgi:transposase
VILLRRFRPPRGPDAMRYMLTDELWAVLGPHVEESKTHTGGQKPDTPDRLFFEAVLYWARTGIPWRDLPTEFGAWDAVYNRLGRWIRSGRLEAVFAALTDRPEFGEVRRVLIDSTIVRAHQHAAGAPRRKKSSGRSGRPRPRVWAAVGAA